MSINWFATTNPRFRTVMNIACQPFFRLALPGVCGPKEYRDER